MVDTKITLNFIIIISLIVVALIYSKHSNKCANKNILLFVIVAFIFTFSKLNSKNELNIENFNSGLNQIRYIKEINLDKSPQNLPDLKSMSLNNKNELKVLTYDKQDHIPAYGDDATIKDINIQNEQSYNNIKDDNIAGLIISNYNDNSKFIDDSIKRDYKFNIQNVDYASQVDNGLDSNETPIETQEKLLYQRLLYPKNNKSQLVDSINNDLYKSFYNRNYNLSDSIDNKEESIQEESTQEESTQEESTQGSSTEGSSTEGSSTEGSSTEDSSTEGSSTEGSSTEGSSTEGSSTEGSSTEGSSTEGSSTEDSSTEGSSTEGSSTEVNIINKIINNIIKLFTDNLIFTSNVESENKKEDTSSEEQGTSIEEEDVNNLYSKIENILQTINEFIRNIFINIYNLLSGDNVEQDTEEAGSEGFVRTILDYITDFFELLILFVTDVMVNISNAFNRKSE